jgi:hypothetical protein
MPLELRLEPEVRVRLKINESFERLFFGVRERRVVVFPEELVFPAPESKETAPPCLDVLGSHDEASRFLSVNNLSDTDRSERGPVPLMMQFDVWVLLENGNVR